MPKASKIKNYKFGLFAETIVCVYLVLSFHRILNRRYKTKLGEVDIIALKGKTIIFIEVKARKKQTDEVLSSAQIKRINNAAKQYLLKNFGYSSHNIRFDLIIFKSVLALKHIKNAWCE